MTETSWVIERINRNPIPQEEMLGYAEEICFLESDARDFDGYAMAAIRFFASEKDKAFSAQFRIEALETFLAEGKIPGWAEETEHDGTLRVRKALVVAAGLQPVSAQRESEPGVQPGFKRTV
ncbi:MAG TPA: hypothetical protein VGS22_20155 [Thermoanaerobaculia bacterium]|jgi:hypothetical protein|nr:hypothetical protein [Thermoanaerobaculia bacterium]